MRLTVALLSLLLLAATPLPTRSVTEDARTEPHAAIGNQEQPQVFSHPQPQVVSAEPQRENHSETAAGDHEADTGKSEAKRWWQLQESVKSAAWIGAIGAITVGVLSLIILSFSVVVANRSVKVAAEALHTHRPYIVIGDVYFTMIPDKHMAWAVTVKYSNLGTGPADLMEVRIHSMRFLMTMITPEPKWGDLHFDHPMSKQHLSNPLVPADKPGTISSSNQPAFNGSLFVNLDESTEWIGVYGYIRYRGATKREYTTRFLWWKVPCSGSCIRSISEELNLRD